ncbi:hypothetical protein PQX77_016748 [Marasmius sp. AFHP31]|nr:hypothetical protein PQX77_016748 [Marasmius sp. AFHP31]
MNARLIQAQIELQEAEQRHSLAQEALDNLRKYLATNAGYKPDIWCVICNSPKQNSTYMINAAARATSPGAAPPASPSPTQRPTLPPASLTIVGSTQPLVNPGRSNYLAYVVYSGENGGHGCFDTWEEAEVLCTGPGHVSKGFADPGLADELYAEFSQSDLGEIFQQPPQAGELIVVLVGVKPAVY